MLKKQLEQKLEDLEIINRRVEVENYGLKEEINNIQKDYEKLIEELKYINYTHSNKIIKEEQEIWSVEINKRCITLYKTELFENSAIYKAIKGEK